jgi:hypothetical protein
MATPIRSKPGAYWLQWDTEESINCTAQGLITNEETNDVWISCTSYLGRGRLILDQAQDPIGIEIDIWNMEALDGPRAVSHKDYAHIGDGDYVERDDGARRELWFGLEGGSSPRVLPAAIARYDADSLAFVGLHIHPTMRTMAFLAFHQRWQVAYVTNWTENDGELIVFDAKTMHWSDRNSTIQGRPADYQDDLKFVQGADVYGDVLYLMSDDFASTLIAIRMTEVYEGEVESVTHLGLGHEREGMTLFGGQKHQVWLLSMDNQWLTWEDHHYAEVICVSLGKSPSANENAGWEYTAFGVVMGLGLSLVALSVSRWWKLRRIQEGAEPSYIEIVQRGEQHIPLT